MLCRRLPDRARASREEDLSCRDDAAIAPPLRRHYAHLPEGRYSRAHPPRARRMPLAGRRSMVSGRLTALGPSLAVTIGGLAGGRCVGQGLVLIAGVGR